MELVSDIVDAPRYQKRTYVPGTQLLAGQPETNTRHGPRVDRWDWRNGECLHWPCVSELPAGDGYELSPIPSRSHRTSDLLLGPIIPRSRETMAAGIRGHIGME